MHHPNRYIYDMVETLLPEAVFDKKKGRGRLLHLWSEPGVERPGWTHVVERKHVDSSSEGSSSGGGGGGKSSKSSSR
jgi:hypothetical protein